MKAKSDAYNSLGKTAGEMVLATIRRFIPYIYAYRNGKEVKKPGCAKRDDSGRN